MIKVEVVIDKHGESQLSVDGVVGKSCTEITKAIEEAIGTTAKRRIKPEYLQQAQLGDVVRDIKQKAGQK